MATNTLNRGRDARKPREIPKEGWKDTLTRVKNETKSDHVSLIAAAMAFYALLAVVPALTAIVLIYALISDPAQITQQMSQLSSVLPEEMRSMLESQLTSLAGQASGSLGTGVIFSLLFSLWSASKGSKALMEALNIIYDEKEERGFIKQNALALGLTLLGAVLSVVAIAVAVALPTVLDKVGLSEPLKIVIPAFSWVLLLGLFSFFLSTAYRFGPNRKAAQWKWVSWGAVTAAVLWLGASLLFSWYASSFGNFNKTYGSLGAIVVLMMWFYISSFVILMGGELNAEMEHQTRKDTTKGPDKPMGERDATMADTLGHMRNREKGPDELRS
jgi:membrane protein